jgi:hypothetical protein
MKYLSDEELSRHEETLVHDMLSNERSPTLPFMCTAMF